ncbi:protein lifeguard 3 isoform X2 [Salmo salar]|uniref:Protein lifeguard 3 isoform X2 n=1 Tax=Salmo salar TaxID=8030 RepID=A0A1S3LZP2_SALSA|nr:protein lifeguard 3-like isoform X2 [Salmo salar]|eukprot:XP_013996325.1 PREDICTED: protein lifeguard 3-like isoform X2 [Salmo salar]
MSRSDFPLGYDDSHSPLYGPQGGNYPPPPAYGFPANGGPPSGQPSSFYPPGPHGPPYPGQPAGYPAGPYPGQPYPGGPGYNNQPMMPPMPPIIPPTMPSSALSGDGEGFAAGSFDSLKVRHSFIRKVYMILASQLLVTVAIVAVFTFVGSVKKFVIANPAVYWASFAVYFVTHIVLVCCKGPRRKFPWNVILLAIFTLAMSYMTGTISSYYDTKAVFLALGITVIVCIITTVFCFQTKIPWLHMVYAAIGAIVYTLFLAYHTQLLLGKGKNSISPEEYVFAALSIYIDIVQIFMCLLQLIGAANR